MIPSYVFFVWSNEFFFVLFLGRQKKTEPKNPNQTDMNRIKPNGI